MFREALLDRIRAGVPSRICLGPASAVSIERKERPIERGLGLFDRHYSPLPGHRGAFLTWAGIRLLRCLARNWYGDIKPYLYLAHSYMRR